MEHEFERQLRALAIERRPEACLGCGFEHGCSVHGCAVIHAAVNRLAAYEETRLEPEDMKKAFNEDATLKLAGQILGVTPGRLRELAQAENKGTCGIPPVRLHQHIFRVFNGAIKEEIVCNAMWEPFAPIPRWRIWVLGGGLPYYWADVFSKTVFLTREAAEAALKEREAEHDR